MRFGKLLLALALALIVLSAAGCISESSVREQDAKEDYFAATGESESQAITTERSFKVDDSMSESHRMLALMILNGAGMSTDEKDYDAVYLVKMKWADSDREVDMVVIERDGKTETVLPQNLTSE